MPHKSNRCRSRKCNAVIAWIITTSKMRMCINPGAIWIREYVPDTDRTVVTTVRGETVSGTRITEAEAQALNGAVRTWRGFIPHWSTCAEPEMFKKGKKRRK